MNIRDATIFRFFCQNSLEIPYREIFRRVFARSSNCGDIEFQYGREISGSTRQCPFFVRKHRRNRTRLENKGILSRSTFARYLTVARRIKANSSRLHIIFSSYTKIQRRSVLEDHRLLIADGGEKKFRGQFVRFGRGFGF